MKKAHAKLSPSAAERWMTCTPSANFELKFKETTSVYAAEGTLAHKLGELLIRQKLNLITTMKFNKELQVIKKHELYEDTMLEFCDDYANFAVEKFSEALADSDDAMIMLEESLDMSKWVPDGFGTGDVVIVSDLVLRLIDLKYGKGKPVTCENNKQMMLYALGALEQFDYIYDIQEVELTIFQPRINNTATWRISVEKLRAWADGELMEKAQLADKGLGEFVPGDHCHFCRAKAKCKALHDYNMEIAQFDFAAGEEISDDDLVFIMSRAQMFTNWINSLQDFALKQALNSGKNWPGYKVVQGTARRKYLDPDKVIQKLLKEGFKEDVITRPIQPLPITEMEKAISKKDFARLLHDLVIIPDGKPTLVPETDKRPAYNSVQKAQEDFDDDYLAQINGDPDRFD
jgi:hypothetical protein